MADFDWAAGSRSIRDNSKREKKKIPQASKVDGTEVGRWSQVPRASKIAAARELEAGQGYLFTLGD